MVRKPQRERHADRAAAGDHDRMASGLGTLHERRRARCEARVVEGADRRRQLAVFARPRRQGPLGGIAGAGRGGRGNCGIGRHAKGLSRWRGHAVVVTSYEVLTL
jgi:hypothetical protein